MLLSLGSDYLDETAGGEELSVEKVIQERFKRSNL